MIKIHETVYNRSQKCGVITTILECGYLICGYDSQNNIHIIDIVIPNTYLNIAQSEVLQDQSLCATTIEAMLPIGLFVGGIFIKNDSHSSIIIPDGKSIFDIINQTFNQSPLNSSHPTFYYLFTNNQNEMNLQQISLKTETIQNINEIEKISKIKQKKCKNLQYLLKKQFVKLHINTQFVSLPSKSTESKYMNYMNAVQSFINQPQHTFTIKYPKLDVILSENHLSDNEDTHNGIQNIVLNNNMGICTQTHPNQLDPLVFNTRRLTSETFEIRMSLRCCILVDIVKSAGNKNIYHSCLQALERQSKIMMFYIREHQDFPHTSKLFYFPSYSFPLSYMPTQDGFCSGLRQLKNIFGITRIKNIVAPVVSVDGRGIFFTDLLISPHKALKYTPPADLIAITKGKYAYCHYGCQKTDDRGWGCAYRCLQIIYSWFILNGLSNARSIPSLRDIQRVLARIGDKPASILGSNTWIGSIEIGMVLENLLNVQYRIVVVNKNENISSFARVLLQHFQENECPIMIGGNKLAHAIIGVALDQVSGECSFLVADPHYYGDDDINRVILTKNIGWKIDSFWPNHQSYNIVLPILKFN